jgi:hypothetical protein
MMSDDDIDAYTVLCIWPGTIIGDSSTDEIVEWFRENFRTRIISVEEIQSLSILDDGSYRNDMIFRMHVDDVPDFVIPRLRTDIKWWGDWVEGLGHRKDYTDFQIDRYRRYEFNTSH